MSNGRIYWLTGQPGHGKTFLGEQLTEFLKTERRNWRRDVFYIDAETIDEVAPTNQCILDEKNGDVVRHAQMISAFLNNCDNDVVVSLISPFRDQREIFKEYMSETLVEIYVFNNDGRKMKLSHIDWYEEPTDNFISIDTTGVEPIDAYANLIHQLRNEKLI